MLVLLVLTPPTIILLILTLADLGYLPVSLNLTAAVPAFELNSEFITQFHDYIFLSLTLFLFLVSYILAFLLKSKLIGDKPIDSDLLHLFWRLFPILLFIFLSIPTSFLVSWLEETTGLSFLKHIQAGTLDPDAVVDSLREDDRERNSPSKKVKLSHDKCTIIDTKKPVADLCNVNTGSDKVAVSIKKVIITNTGDAIANAWVLAADHTGEVLDSHAKTSKWASDLDTLKEETKSRLTPPSSNTYHFRTPLSTYDGLPKAVDDSSRRDSCASTEDGSRPPRAAVVKGDLLEKPKSPTA